MALDMNAVGKTTEVFKMPYSWKDTALYALGIGAKREELDFLYEGRGPKVFPTFAVIPGFEPCMDLAKDIGGDVRGVVHAGQSITLHRDFPTKGVLHTTARVDGIYDLKRMAQVNIVTETTLEDGEKVCDTEWTIFYRFDGGFDGPRPPKSFRVKVPDREPDAVVEEKVSEEQALLYRLSGDINPLHADPDMAKAVGFEAPILHGLCSYGYIGRAALHHFGNSDPTSLKSLVAQFRKPVWPGDTLVIQAWKTDEGVILRAETKEKPGEIVLTNCLATFS